MNLIYLALLALPAEPPLQTTIERNAAMSDQTAKIQRLGELLKTVSEPLGQPGAVADKDYVERVETVLKVRAVLLIEMRDATEKALIARYNLEAIIEDYAEWEKIERERLEKLRKDHQEGLEREKTILDGIDNERRVVLNQVRLKLEAQAKTLRLEMGQEAEAKRLEDIVAAIKSKIGSISTLENKAELERKYAGQDAQQLQVKFKELSDDYEVQADKIDVASKDMIVSPTRLIENLSKSHAEQHAQAKVLLEQCKRLPIQGEKIAIASRQVAIMLAAVESASSLQQKKQAVQKNLIVDADIVSVLRYVTGVQQPVADPLGGIFEPKNPPPAPPATPTPPVTPGPRER